MVSGFGVGAVNLALGPVAWAATGAAGAKYAAGNTLGERCAKGAYSCTKGLECKGVDPVDNRNICIPYETMGKDPSVTGLPGDTRDTEYKLKGYLIKHKDFFLRKINPKLLDRYLNYVKHKEGNDKYDNAVKSIGKLINDDHNIDKIKRLRIRNRGTIIEKLKKKLKDHTITR